ncbi:MAG TPA: hypothetical protein PLB25_18830 [Rhodoferax sp.]|nr:hypothetical protein [Rhodoferax sp.]
MPIRLVAEVLGTIRKHARISTSSHQMRNQAHGTDIAQSPRLPELAANLIGMGNSSPTPFCFR